MLNVSLKFIQGDPHMRLDKVVCMSAFHLFTEGAYIKSATYSKYIQYLLQTVMSLYVNHRDWWVRLYIDDSVSSNKNPDAYAWDMVFDFFRRLPTVQIIRVRWEKHYDPMFKCHKGLLPAFFRYFALFDDAVGICIFRDIDNVWTEQDFYFTDKWISSGEDGFMYIDPSYQKREVSALTQDNVVYDGDAFLSILGGVWGYRVNHNALNLGLWTEMVACMESSNSCVFEKKYKGFKHYQNRFIYGFEELVLSRILIPRLIMLGKSFKSVTICIWYPEGFSRLFDSRLKSLHDQIGLVGNVLTKVQSIVMENYWDMESNTTGLSQYLLCLITNIYFRIIVQDAPRFKGQLYLIPILKEVYPTPYLMSMGLFVFKNFLKYDWQVGREIVRRSVTDDYVIDWNLILASSHCVKFN